MDNYTLYLFKKNERFNITNLINNLSWSESIDTLGTQLSFDKAINKDDYLFPNIEIELGDLIVLLNNNIEIFRGIITDLNRSSLYQASYTAFDFAFYLNKSKTIIQFNKIEASKAIKQLLSKVNVVIGNITPINTLVDKIYNDKYINKIIKDILDQSTAETGIQYRMEMQQNKLNISKYTDLKIQATYQMAENLAPFNITKAINSSFSISQSIADLKNSIKIISSEEKSTRIIGEAKDQESINKYGLLQEIETVDKKDISKARNIAKQRLKELNKIIQDTSIEMLGSDQVKAGRILELNEPKIGLIGSYLIKECTHSFNNGIHKVNVNLGVL